MIMRSVLLFFAMFLVSETSLAQEEKIHVGDKLLRAIDVTYLPKNGNFITLQVGAMFRGGLSDKWFFCPFVLLKPVFVSNEDGVSRFSIGIFNNYDEAKKLKARLSGIFPRAFPVAYQNGKRVPLSEFHESNVSQQMVDVDGAIETVKRIVDVSYYRIQVGYYEKDGLEPAELKIYKKLSQRGLSCEPVPYEKGRIYVTSKSVHSIDKAVEMLQKIEGITGREAIIKPYFEDLGIHIYYLNWMYGVLK